MEKIMEKNFQHWMTLLGLSVVSMISMRNHFDDDLDTTEQRWAMSVAATSLCLSALACIFHFVLKEIFVVKLFEFGMVLVVLALWCAGLPTIMDYEHNIAVAEWGTILNGNIFFSSWGALLISLLLAAKHVQVLLGHQETLFFVEWVFFAAASLVVVASGSTFFKDFNCSDLDDIDECDRTVFGVTLGVISIVFSFFFFLKVPQIVSQVGSILLAVAWAIAAAYLTFDKGPATQVGTQYFATWAALFLILNVASAAFKDLFAMFFEDKPPVAETGDDEKVVDLGAKGDNEDVEEEEVAAQP